MTIDQLHEAVVAECTPESIAGWPTPPAFKSEHGYTTYGYGGYYAYLAMATKLIKPKIAIELGTEMGRGTAAIDAFLSEGQRLYTYDIVDPYTPIETNYTTFVVHNILDDVSSPNHIYAQADFIFLDVNPHDGVKEKSMIKLLQQSWPVGKTVWMFFDDIKHPEGMRTFWKWFISQPGVDAKDVSNVMGHHGAVCGFGIAKVTT
jgi:hypothetical protein